MDEHVQIIRAKNGQIEIRRGYFVKKVDVRELYPDAKIEAVKQAILEVGGVWNEDVEGFVHTKLFI